MPYKPVSDYGLIGNMRTAALVGIDGSIDWLCLPHFDSPSVFGAILDAAKGGRYRISPAERCKQQQFYYPETNILITRFLHSDGVGELNDFMPVKRPDDADAPEPHRIYRRVTCVRGAIRFQLRCYPAFDYARAAHRLEVGAEGAVFRADGAALGLRGEVPLHAVGNGVEAEFTLAEGEHITFVLNYRPDGGDPLEPAFDGDLALRDTINFWHEWLAQCTYSGRWREMVYRSALLLKLLTFEPTGAMVAAPTTSLPEEIGGERNWDYRFTWIRDTSFSMYALLRIGFTHEAGRFMDWLIARTKEISLDGSLQIMYGIDGRHDLGEEMLSHLEGYAGSRPVRVGNNAATQLQLDIYGELLDAIYLYNKYGVSISYGLWVSLIPLLDWVCDNWHRADEGIWENRGGRKHFVFSKVMCWVALERAIRIADKRGFPANHQKWREVRDTIYKEVMSKGWDREQQTFVQHYKTGSLDAANLVMPLVFFVSPQDPRMLATLDRTLEYLVSDSLVFRYRNIEDGLGGQEGTFTMCTFWLVEALTRAGRLHEARLIFEKMLSYANHLGLYSEEISPTGDLLGNFPQAFSHFSLISAAYNLDRAIDKRKSGGF